MQPLEEVYKAKKQLDLALQSVDDTEKFFVIDHLIAWLKEEQARTRERINFDSGAFNVDEAFT